MPARVIRTPDQRLRVFVSSTLQELADERAAVRTAVEQLRLAPVMFELGARPHPPRDLYRAYLDQSHIFVGIYWQSYGWIAPDETISGLEDEYRLADNLPKLIYIKTPAPDRQPRLEQLLDGMRADDQVSYKQFATAAELRELVEADLLVLLTERFESAQSQSGAAGAADGLRAPSNLPLALDSFIGRAHELAEIERLLGDARLVTLLGPGGTGKTRLALHAAQEVRDAFDDRVYFVDLSPCRDVDATLSAIARSIGIREPNNRALVDDLKSAIGDQTMLLVLDNFEQVTVAAPVVADLLRDCAHLQALVTTREALRVRGEHVLTVPPLGLPSLGPASDRVDELLHSEAVQLFVERARAVKPDFDLDADNAASIGEICVRLDGLPLAIELAAARLVLFSPQELVNRLADRLQLLRGGSRDAPARQQTLRDAIDWSYELLEPAERRLFQICSVFSGATLEAVEVTARGIADLDPIGVVDGCTSLVEKSLVRKVDHPATGSRLVMLETVREFAAGKLDEDATLCRDVRRAHAEYYTDFTAQTWDALTGSDGPAVAAHLLADLGNVRTAWDYWVAEADFEHLSQLTDSLWFLYYTRGWHREIVKLTTDLLELVTTTPATALRIEEHITLQTSLARGLFALRGYTEEVEAAYRRAVELYEGQGQIPELLPVLRSLASFHIYRAELDKGLAIGQRLLDLAERYDDAEARVEGHLVVGACLALGSEIEPGIDHLDAGIASYHAEGHPAGRFRLGNNPAVVCFTTSALALWMLGFPERARDRAHEGIAFAQRIDHPTSIAYAQFHAGLLHLWLRDDRAAHDCALEVIAIAHEQDFPLWFAVGSILRGAALAGLESPDTGLAIMQSGIESYVRLTTPPVFLPLLRQLEARTCGAAGRPRDGLTLIDEAIELASGGTGATLTSEFLALKGDLLLQASASAVEAESLYQAALAAATDVGARTLQLRAALRLARLWSVQGRTVEARALLAPIVGSVTEGFATADVADARALLDSFRVRSVAERAG